MFRKEVESFYDPNSKLPLFHPQIKPKFQTRSRCKSVFEYLYEDGATRRIKAALQESSENISRSNYINETSAAIVEMLEKERIEEIFDALDTDSNGILNSSDLNFEQIEPATLELFWPLFLEIEERRISVTKAQFYEATTKLRVKWSVLQRNFIRRGKKNN